MAKAKPIGLPEVVEFVARHVPRFPRSVIAQSLADWEKAVAAERGLMQGRTAERPTAPKSVSVSILA